MSDNEVNKLLTTLRSMAINQRAALQQTEQVIATLERSEKPRKRDPIAEKWAAKMARKFVPKNKAA